MIYPIKLEVDSRVVWEGDVYPEDLWNRPDTDWAHTIRGFSIAEKYGDTEIEADEPPSILYGVIAIWSTGDSFGRDSNKEIELMFASEDMDEAEAEMRRLLMVDENDYSIPWSGYFERLTSLEVETLLRVSPRR